MRIGKKSNKQPVYNNSKIVILNKFIVSYKQFAS